METMLCWPKPRISRSRLISVLVLTYIAVLLVLKYVAGLDWVSFLMLTAAYVTLPADLTQPVLALRGNWLGAIDPRGRARWVDLNGATVTTAGEYLLFHNPHSRRRLKVPGWSPLVRQATEWIQSPTDQLRGEAVLLPPDESQKRAGPPGGPDVALPFGATGILPWLGMAGVAGLVMATAGFDQPLLLLPLAMPMMHTFAEGPQERYVLTEDALWILRPGAAPRHLSLDLVGRVRAPSRLWAEVLTANPAFPRLQISVLRSRHFLRRLRGLVADE